MKEKEEIAEAKNKYFSHDQKKFPAKEYSKKERKEISFWDIEKEEISHTTELNDLMPDWRNVIGYLTNKIRKDMRLRTGHEVLYPKVQKFIEEHLFEKKVDLSDPNTIRNLSELEVQQTIYIEFRKAINELTIEDTGSAEVQNHISIKETSPFITKQQEAVHASKSVFNKIVGDSHFELEFASWLDEKEDIISFAKNFLAVNFKIDYQKEDGDLSNFYPDFLVKVSDKEVWIVETKGREDLDDVRKMKRLEQWCKDVNKAQDKVTFSSLYVKQDQWDNLERSPESFEQLVKLFKG